MREEVLYSRNLDLMHYIVNNHFVTYNDEKPKALNVLLVLLPALTNRIRIAKN